MAVNSIARFAPLGVLVCSLVLSLLVSSCEPPKGPGAHASGAPKVQVIGGDTINWGRVSPDALKHELKITNAGGDTLKITNVQPGCGCTTAPIDKKELLPGDTATIKVTLDASNRNGELHKTITITTNDTTRKSFQVSLLAHVVREIVATPEFFPIVDSAKTGVEDTTSIEVKNTGDQPVTIEPPTFASAPEMLVRFDMNAPATLQPGASIRVLAHVKPIKAGTVSAEVLFKTSSKNMATMKVPLTVVVREM